MSSYSKPIRGGVNRHWHKGYSLVGLAAIESNCKVQAKEQGNQNKVQTKVCLSIKRFLVINQMGRIIHSLNTALVKVSDYFRRPSYRNQDSLINWESGYLYMFLSLQTDLNVFIYLLL